MALTGRSVDAGTGIDVLVDTGATADMQVMKLAISTAGSQSLVPSDAVNGLSVDVTRLAPGTSATSLGKAEDAIAASGDVGVMSLAIRRDAPVSDVTNGDYSALHVDNLGRLRVTGTQLEDAAATTGDAGNFVLAVRRDAPTSGAAAGDYHEFAVDATGRLWVSGTVAEDAAHVSGDYGQFVLGVQSLTRTARSADGDYTPFAVDAAGAQFVGTIPEANASWACSNYSAIAATSGVIKASAGKLYGAILGNENAAVRFLQFFNLTAVPANGTVPLFMLKIFANQTQQIDFSAMGKYFSTGICWANSTTPGTLTLGSADNYVEARYL